ncbi:MAG TPA: HD domain-containing phosphohydrolase [Pirellulales bacterium]
MHKQGAKVSARWLWVLALASCQMLCLIVTLAWYGKLLERGLTLALRGQIAAVNSEVVGEFAAFVGEWGISDLRPGSQDFQRVQSLIERFRLPNNGYLYLADARTGKIICHPTLQDDARGPVVPSDPKLIEQTLGKITPGGTIGGWVDLPDGTHYFTIRDLADCGALLVADQHEGENWAVVDHITTPLWTFGAFVTVVLVLLGTAFSMGIIHGYENTLENINARLERTIAQRSRALVNTRDAVIFGLAKLADSRDAETGEHLDRVHEYIAILAKELARHHTGIDEEYIERLKLASSLHDIGKVGIRDEILLKPGKLTSEERKVMQTHGVIGARCLASIQQRLGDDDFLDMACEIAAAHHERWDGLGYPYGLKGEEIPLSARIVAVADVYDALTTQRVYRDAMPHEEAMQLILSGAGTQFDPSVVDAFRACIDSIEQVAEKFSSGEYQPISPVADDKSAAEVVF